MTSGAPRSLRGHRDGTSEAGRLATHRSGLSMSDWLNTGIARNAMAEESPPWHTQRNNLDDDVLAATIESLSREIDDADETARTTIEGMRADARDAALAGDIGKVAGTIRRLGEQICSGAEPIHSKQDGVTSAGLDAIRIRLEALLAASQQTPPGADRGPLFRLVESQTEEERSCLTDKPADEKVSAAVANVTAPQQSSDDQIDLGVLARGQRQIEESVHSLHGGLAALFERLAAPAAATTESVAIVVEALDRLESRLDAVLDRFDTVLEQPTSGEGIEEIRAEIGRIRREIADRDLHLTAGIESQLAGFARRLDAAHGADRSGPALKALEEQVARLTSQLERGAAQSPSLKNIEARLLNLESLLLASRQEGAGAASKIACGAVPAASGQPLGAHELLKATGTDGAGVAVRPVGPGRTFNSGSPGEGVVRTNLSALRKLAKNSGDDDDTTDRRADFIAAARRAAQAAAKTEKLQMPEVADDAKAGAFARIGRAIRNRRRAMLAATAALVLAVPAVHMFGGGDAATIDGRLVASASSMAISGSRGGSGASPEVVLPSTAPENLKARRSVAKPLRQHSNAFVFAAPEPLYARFKSRPLAPTARAFVRMPDRRGLLPLAEAIGSAELREAATAGDPRAAVEVAARYAEGRLVPRDLAKAAQWYELAAEQNVAVAQYRLASLYERGQGVAKDPSVAAGWYRRAAEQGNTGAMHNLAVMMSVGIDGVPNHMEAAEWFRAAADRGFEDSQYNLGVIYARGLGQDRNLVESYKWFALAAAGGDREAGAHRDEIDSALSIDDRANARAAVDAWQPAPMRAQANTMAVLPPAWSDPTDGITEADRRALVMEIQTALAEQGYDPGPADGYEGPRTRQAVRAFQRNIGLAETGRISNDLVAALADPSG